MDEYWSYVEDWWPTIHRAYTDFEEKRPVILVAIDEGKVYAYPYEEFKKELTPASQHLLERQYGEAKRGDEMVVFVRDHPKRKLVSYSCPVHSAAAGPNKRPAPARSRGRVRAKGATSRSGRGG